MSRKISSVSRQIVGENTRARNRLKGSTHAKRVVDPHFVGQNTVGFSRKPIPPKESWWVTAAADRETFDKAVAAREIEAGWKSARNRD